MTYRDWSIAVNLVLGAELQGGALGGGPWEFHSSLQILPDFVVDGATVLCSIITLFKKNQNNKQLKTHGAFLFKDQTCMFKI